MEYAIANDGTMTGTNLTIYLKAESDMGVTAYLEWYLDFIPE